MRPLGDVVIARVDAMPEKHGALYLPQDRMGEQPRTATVIAVGPGRVTRRGVRVEPRVRAGDRIVYQLAGVRAVIAADGSMRLHASDIAGGETVLVSEQHVLAVYDGATEAIA